MKPNVWLFFFLVSTVMVNGQSDDFKDVPRKGSYLYYGQPAFEDNSFLLEEAINQEKGIMQYISNFYFNNIKGGDFLYSFTQEIPITHLRHQISYTLLYEVLNSPPTGTKSNGLGDINLEYNYMVTGKKDWAMVVPGVTLIIPTGQSGNGHGAGGFGGKLSLALTKRLSHKLVTHFNLGYTYIAQADRYTLSSSGGRVLAFEKDLQFKNLGASVIWYQSRKFNWLLECTSSYLTNINTDGTLGSSNQITINPGFRFAIDHNRVQIVPGFSMPSIFTNGKFDRTGVFFYLSFEGEYLPFTKAKNR